MILRPTAPTRKQRLATAYTTSSMKIAAYRSDNTLRWLLLKIDGPAAKLPSTTNNKMLTVPRSHVMRYVDHLRVEHSARTPQGFAKLATMVRELRAMMTKAPAHLEQLEVLAGLYKSASAGTEYKFDFDKDRRGLVLMLLSPSLNRHDSHNIPKATLDLLQELGVIPNDRHVDAMAIRKTDWGIEGDSTEIMIETYSGECVGRTSEVFSKMRSILDRLNQSEQRNAKQA